LVSCGDDLLQGCLIPDYPDRMIIDLDPVHDRFNVGLPERDWPRRDLLSHDLPEPLDGFCISVIFASSSKMQSAIKTSQRFGRLSLPDRDLAPRLT